MDGPVCRCGHYRSLHTTGRYACILRTWPWTRLLRPAQMSGRRTCDCDRFRPARWIDRHSLWRHVAVRVWWATPVPLAWWIVRHWPIPGRCWCDLYGSIQPIEDRRYRDDFDGRWSCMCDALLPTDAGVPVGRCYCPVKEG